MIRDNYFQDSLRKTLKYEIIYQPRCHLVESQKGIKAVQGCSIEKQKGNITA